LRHRKSNNCMNVLPNWTFRWTAPLLNFMECALSVLANCTKPKRDPLTPDRNRI